MEQLIQQLLQMFQSQGLGRTGGQNPMGNLLPQTPGTPAPNQSPLTSGANPLQHPPALQNVGQQAQQQFNPRRLLSTPSPGGLQGMGL